MIIELDERPPRSLIVGVDPGPTELGYAIMDRDYNCIWASKGTIDELFVHLLSFPDKIEAVAIESIQSYGMQMGRSTIETCYCIGRVVQVCIDNEIPFDLIPRPEYGKAITGTNRVKDPLIRTALENRFGGYKKGEPLFRLAGATDKRSAFAVGAYYLDKNYIK